CWRTVESSSPNILATSRVLRRLRAYQPGSWLLSRLNSSAGPTARMPWSYSMTALDRVSASNDYPHQFGQYPHAAAVDLPRTRPAAGEKRGEHGRIGNDEGAYGAAHRQRDT